MNQNNLTQQFLSKLPPWFSMRHNVQSVGARLLDVVAKEIETTEAHFNQAIINVNLHTADTNQIDYLYRYEATLPIQIETEITVFGDGVRLTPSLSLYQFMATDDNRLFLPETYVLFEKNIYTRTEYGQLSISILHNGETHTETLSPMEHHAWNIFDEFGLLFDTPRIKSERNSRYKERLLGVFKNRANSSLSGLINGISRELDLPHESISIHTLHNKNDTAFQNELQTVDKRPTEMLRYYVDRIKPQIPIMWGQFVWGEGFWDVSNLTNNGAGIIPSFYDAIIQ